jgi:hypothetical protein
MPAIPPEIEGAPVQPRPMLQASADPRGCVSLIHHDVPTARDGAAGPVVLGLVLDTLRGRSPLYRFAVFFAHQATARLVGKALPPPAFREETGRRVRARLDDFGTMQRFSARGARAAMRCGVERRDVHLDTPARRVWGDEQCAAPQALPRQVTDGESQDKWPDLTHCVLAPLWMARAVPIWGKPEEGHASEKTLHTAVVSEIARLLAHYGVHPGALLSVADAALGPEDNLAARGEPVLSPRLPATYSACGRVMAEAVARNPGQEGGRRAQTPPTKPRPGPLEKVAAAVGP